MGTMMSVFKHDCYITIKVPKDVKINLKLAAKCCGITISEFMARAGAEKALELVTKAVEQQENNE